MLHSSEHRSKYVSLSNHAYSPRDRWRIALGPAPARCLVACFLKHSLREHTGLYAVTGGLDFLDRIVPVVRLAQHLRTQFVCTPRRARHWQRATTRYHQMVMMEPGTRDRTYVYGDLTMLAGHLQLELDPAILLLLLDTLMAAQQPAPSLCKETGRERLAPPYPPGRLA
jgi:hypothetical protein